MPCDELGLKFVNWEKTQMCTPIVCADSEALDVALSVSKVKSAVINVVEVWASIGATLVETRNNSVFVESF